MKAPSPLFGSLILITVLTLLSFSTPRNEENPPPVTTAPWLKIIGDASDNFLNEIFYDNNHLYHAARHGSNPNRRPELAKFDLSGNLVWRKRFGIDSLTIRNFTFTPNGDIIFIGRQEPYQVSFDNYTFMGKMDANGNLIWMDKLDRNNRREDLTRIVYAPDSDPATCDYFVQGVSNYGSNGFADRAYLIAMDEDGNVCWEYFYGVYSDNEIHKSLSVTSGGNILLSGNALNGRGILLFVDRDTGNDIKTYEYNDDLFIEQAKPLPSGETLIFCRRVLSGPNKAVIAKVDIAGTPVWAYSIDGHTDATRLILDPNNSDIFYTSSSTDLIENTNRWVLGRWKDEGNSLTPLGGRVLYQPGESTFSNQRLTILPTGEIAVLESKQTPNGFGQRDLVLGLFTPLDFGTNECTVSQFDPTLTTFPLTKVDRDAEQYVFSTTRAPLTPTITDIVYPEVDICPGTCDADFDFTGGCGGIDFTNNSTSVPGATYLWDFGDGTTSSAENPSHAFPNTNDYWVSLTITAPDGCEDVYATFVSGNDPDNTDPVVTCPDDILIPVPPGVSETPVYYGSPTVTDNCPTLSRCNPRSGKDFDLGVNQVTCRAKDVPAGNTGACAFDIELIESSFPNCPYPENKVIDPGFTVGYATWQANNGSPEFFDGMGCLDDGYFRMKASFPQRQSLYQENVFAFKFSEYKLSFCARFSGGVGAGTYVKFKFYASQTPLTGFDCVFPACDVIGESVQITSNTWTSYELPIWTAPKNYKVLTVVAELESDVAPSDLSQGDIDNICLTLEATPPVAPENNSTGLITPNPFNQNFTLQLPEDLELEDPNIKIRDLNGREMMVRLENNGHQSWDVNMESATSGVYIIEITDEGTGYTKILRIVKQ